MAGRQASYDGALGARGIRSLNLYGQRESVSVNNASTISSIYHGGQLKMFTIHPSQPTSPGSKIEYYMHQLNTWGMTGSIEHFDKVLHTIEMVGIGQRSRETKQSGGRMRK